MSSDTPNAPSPRDRREAVREKAQQVRAQQSRARLVRRSALALGAVAAVAALAVVVTWAVSSAMGRPQLSPQNLDDDGFAVTSITGSLSAPAAGAVAEATPTPTPTPTPAAEETEAAGVPAVEIDVYVDYLSPGAREWQIANAQQMSSWVNDGAVTLAYHPVSMLTAKSNGTKYSLRAAGAAACVATHSPATFFTFNSELLTRQPAVDSDGFSDEELADLAQAAGVEDPKTVRSCIRDSAYISWVKDATERAVSGIPGTDGLGLTGTPMILVNGQQYVGVLGDPAEFSQFVLTSASDAFYKTQATPTPTVSPTP
ncbi:MULTISPECIES: DsbA family protein [Microbacterium]|uniref:Protein-disulfide isomerase n=1 Tax=Microbacterium saccharophilum TaxID=1213358 RepID=A0A7Z7GCA6_9MICO|nr:MULTISPECIES: thioredoxin domain-containing protein [Microbacterium]SFI20825.1 Protein-disulfide isomerase [Microbacterium saccharophilum]